MKVQSSGITPAKRSMLYFIPAGQRYLPNYQKETGQFGVTKSAG
jgi:hypothetical protein